MYPRHFSSRTGPWPDKRASESNIDDKASSKRPRLGNLPSSSPAANVSKPRTRNPFEEVDSDEEQASIQTPPPPPARDAGPTDGLSIPSAPLRSGLLQPALKVPKVTIPNSSKQRVSFYDEAALGRSTYRPEHSSLAQDHLRQIRIEEKIERNRRYREEDARAAAIEDQRLAASQQQPPARAIEHSIDNVGNLDRPSSTLQAPVPLNSPAGIQALQATHPKEPRKVGRVTTNDMYALSLRESKLSWAQVAEVYERHTGVKRTGDSTRKRISTISNAMQAARVTAAQKRALLDGTPGAEAELNRVLERWAGTADEHTGVTGHVHRPSIVGERAERFAHQVTRQNIDPVHAPIPRIPATSTLVPAPDSLATAPMIPFLQSTTVAHDTAITHDNLERPTIGGKQPSWALLQSIFNSTLEEEEEESDMASEVSQDSIDPAGFNHFEYQPQRRELLATQGTDIDDVLWRDVNDPYTTLPKANAAAAGNILFHTHGNIPIINGQMDHTVKVKFEEHDCVHCEFECERGKVQTRVVRNMRKYSEKIPADTTTGRITRTLYHVKQRIITRADDGLFDEGRILAVQETYVDARTSADLGWANNEAINKFVEMTYVATTANLNIRDVEVAEEKNKLHEELDQKPEHTMFHGIKDTTKGKVEVFVEKGKLIGPRNI